jgi:hypothetical protein
MLSQAKRHVNLADIGIRRKTNQKTLSGIIGYINSH